MSNTESKTDRIERVKAGIKHQPAARNRRRHQCHDCGTMQKLELPNRERGCAACILFARNLPPEERKRKFPFNLEMPQPFRKIAKMESDLSHQLDDPLSATLMDFSEISQPAARHHLNDSVPETHLDLTDLKDNPQVPASTLKKRLRALSEPEPLGLSNPKYRSPYGGNGFRIPKKKPSDKGATRE